MVTGDQQFLYQWWDLSELCSQFWGLRILWFLFRLCTYFTFYQFLGLSKSFTDTVFYNCNTVDSIWGMNPKQNMLFTGVVVCCDRVGDGILVSARLPLLQRNTRHTASAPFMIFWQQITKCYYSNWLKYEGNVLCKTGTTRNHAQGLSDVNGLSSGFQDGCH